MKTLKDILDAHHDALKQDAEQMDVDTLRNEFVSATMSIIAIAHTLPCRDVGGKTPSAVALEIVGEIKALHKSIVELQEKLNGDTLLLDYIESDCCFPAMRDDGETGQAFIVVGAKRHSLRDMVKMLIADNQAGRTVS